jgi:hypothetical protein
MFLLDDERCVQLADPLGRGCRPRCRMAARRRTSHSSAIARSRNCWLLRQGRDLWHEVTSGDSLARTFEAVARAIEEQSGTCGWVLVLRDVTRVRRTERQATIGHLAAERGGRSQLGSQIMCYPNSGKGTLACIVV